MTDIGSISVEEAYAQGKMLDHSSWQKGKTLPRGITASDVDVVFDNGGSVILAELSRVSQWNDIRIGQRKVYEALIWEREHCAVVCTHDVVGRLIDTRMDIIAFQPMVFHEGAILVCPIIEGNDKWQNFVLSWYDDVQRVRGILIERAQQAIWG